MTDLISRNNKDLHDAYSLGYVSIEWLAVLIKQISKEIKCIQKELMEKGCGDNSFYDLDKLIAITSFTADEQLEHFDSIKTRFKESTEQSRISLSQYETLVEVVGNRINNKAVKL